MRFSILYIFVVFSYTLASSPDQKDVKVAIVNAPSTTTMEITTEYYKEQRKEQQRKENELIEELKKNHQLCMKGEDRSPVDIGLAETVPIYVPGIEFVNYNIRVNVTTLGSNYTGGYKGFNKLENQPCIKGANLKGEYVLWEYHQNFYHSTNRNKYHEIVNYGRVEHTVDEATHDFEGHLVHVKRGMTLEEAQGVPGAIVIVAVWYVMKDSLWDHLEASGDIDSYNEMMQTIFQPENSTDITFRIKPNQFIPNDTTSFFTYEGSMAAAPCSRGVTWYILSEPVNVPVFKKMSMIYGSNQMNPIDLLAEPQSLGSRMMYFNYGVEKKPTSVDKGYPTYVLVLVILSIAVATCVARYAQKKIQKKNPNQIQDIINENYDAEERNILVDSEILFSF